MPELKDKIVGYYVTGPDGRQDFSRIDRQGADAAYAALEGKPRAIGRWRERVGPDQPLLVGNTLVQRRARSRYGDLIESDPPSTEEGP